MSQVFDADGNVVPVTLVQLSGSAQGLELNTPVAVTGKSKGKGFAGVMKRWGFSGQQKTHGQSDRERAPGSIGAGTDPGRVLKGKHMPGRMGCDRVTVRGLYVVEAPDENNIVKISGAVPGHRNSELEISIVEDKKD